MLSAYTWLLRLLVPAILLRLLLRGWRNHEYWRRIPERFGFVARPPRDEPILWIHAVSVGEVRAAAPLVRALAERHPEYRVFLTTMTPTGSATAAMLFDGRVAHSYVPYDLPSAVDRFLARLRPAAAMVMETEIWPNLYHRLAAQGVPLLLANVRLSARSFERYRRYGGRLLAATLSKVSAFAVQSETDAARLVALGAPRERVHITGSVKFELELPASLREDAEVLRRQWGAGRPVWVAGSTHAGEEELVLDAYRMLKGRFPDELLVLVPRHPERFGAVARLARRAGWRTALRSETRAKRALDPQVEVLVGDSMGELMLFYGAADAAFIGGSLVARGGQNLLEAAALGRPVVFGPHMFNFRDIAALALARGAAVEVRDASALAEAIGVFLTDAERRFAAGEAGRQLLEEHRGAAARTLSLLQALLDERKR